MKNRNRSFRDSLVQAMEIPQDLAYSQPVMTLVGQRELVVENYKSIRKLSKDYIELQTKTGIVTVCGKKLTIPYYSGGELKIQGIIEQISIKGQVKNHDR